MIYDGRFKYVHRLRGDHELYDLEADPAELRNLYPELVGAESASADPGTAPAAADSSPALTQNQLSDAEKTELLKRLSAFQSELLNWYQATCDVVPYEGDSRFSTDQFWGIFGKRLPAAMEQPFKEYIRREHPSISAVIQHLQSMMAKRP